MSSNRLRAVLWTLAIFLSAPFAFPIQRAAARSLGRGFFVYSVLAVVALSFARVVYVRAFRLKVKGPGRYVWLAVSAALYAYFVLRRKGNPVEAVHFLEYGLLAYFLYRAWNDEIGDPSIYLAVFFSGTLIGTLDEIIQWMTPDRYWDIRDVGLNALSVGLFLLALGTVVRPKPARARVSLRSFRIVSVLFGANLVLMGGCLSLTPARLAALTASLPFLAPLEHQEPMGNPAGGWMGGSVMWLTIFGILIASGAATVLFRRISPPRGDRSSPR